MSNEIHGTTIVAVRKDGHVAIAGDGQATMGESYVVKGTSRKVMRIYNNKVIIGFAGGVADAMLLADVLEASVSAQNGDLLRAGIDFAKKWRSDKMLRNLNAMLLATDGKVMLEFSGDGNVLDPDGDVLAIGSGGFFALAAARAYLDSKADLSAEEIAKRSIQRAAEICVYTNDNIRCEVI